MGYLRSLGYEPELEGVKALQRAESIIWKICVASGCTGWRLDIKMG
jgi:hypothetical protein